jgi:hypothetical protein
MARSRIEDDKKRCAVMINLIFGKSCFSYLSLLSCSEQKMEKKDVERCARWQDQGSEKNKLDVDTVGKLPPNLS